MNRARFGLVLVVAAAGLLRSSAARADDGSGDAATRAEALFQAAQKLITEKRFGEACPMLAESQRLDPGGGTLVNLAMCHVSLGQTATAWTELHDALATAQRDKRPDREAYVNEQLALIGKTLATLSVDVPDELRTVPGLVVTRDGLAVAAPEWGISVPIDPGAHAVSATAPGRQPFIRSLTVATSEKAHVQVTLPIAMVAPPITTASAPPPPIAPRREPATSTSTSNTRYAAYGAFGLGLVAIGVGSAFGATAFSRWADAKQACPTTLCSNAAGVSERDAAKHAAIGADVSIGVGIAALGTAAYLIFAADRPAATGSLRVAPVVSAHGGLATLSGGF